MRTFRYNVSVDGFRVKRRIDYFKWFLILSNDWFVCDSLQRTAAKHEHFEKIYNRYIYYNP